MKKILILLFALAFYPPPGTAQLNQTGKSFRSYNADSLTVQTEVTGLVLMYTNVGAIYYNVQASPPKWRCFENGVWIDCFGGSGGGGVNIYNSNGVLTGHRTVDGGGFNFSFNNAANMTFSSFDGTGGGTIDIQGTNFLIQYQGATTTNAIALNDLGVSITNAKAFFPGTATSAAIKLQARGSDPTTALSDGDIWYDNNVNKFRGRESGASKNLITTVTADNGLNVNITNNTRLGGSLVVNTTITGGGFDLTLGTTGSDLKDFIVNALESVALVGNNGFSQIFIDDTGGDFLFAIGASGSTTANAEFSNLGKTLINASPLVAILKTNPTASNNAPSSLLSLTAINTGGAGANGYGAYINVGAENTGGGGNENIGRITWSYLDATSTSEDTEMHFDLLENSLSVTSLEIRAVGTEFRYIFNRMPTSCTGQPTNSVAAVAGVLTLCP